MARTPRIHFTGAVYHVMSRGNGGQPLFYNDIDYTVFEKLIEEGVDRFDHQIHGYCWMPNHIHMVVEVAGIPLSKIIHNLSFRYTRRINKKEGRTGHLFQGRYKAILIDTDHYLLDLIRYIHLNPVRASLVKLPEDYMWSGHNVYLGKRKNNWLSTDWVLSRFNRRKSDARKDYRRFISRGVGEEYRQEFHIGNKNGIVLGEDEFVVKLPEFGKFNNKNNQAPWSLAELSEKVSAFFGINESLLHNSNRNRLASKIRTIIALEFTEHSGSISKVAEYFGRDVSTLSRQLTNLQKKLTSDKSLQDDIKSLKSKLTQ